MFTFNYYSYVYAALLFRIDRFKIETYIHGSKALNKHSTNIFTRIEALDISGMSLTLSRSIYAKS